jgi:hypothetical protein
MHGVTYSWFISCLGLVLTAGGVLFTISQAQRGPNSAEVRAERGWTNSSRNRGFQRFYPAVVLLLFGVTMIVCGIGGVIEGTGPL